MRLIEHLRGGLAATLHLVATEPVDRLRRESDVRHHRDPDVDEPVHEVELRALELHGVGAALLDQPAGVADAVLDGGLERHERHVPDHHRPFDPAGDGTRVVEHLLHRHGELVRVPENVATDRVADQEHRDPGAVEDLCGREVVRGQHRPPLAFGLPRVEVVDRNGHLLAPPGSARPTIGKHTRGRREHRCQYLRVRCSRDQQGRCSDARLIYAAMGSGPQSR
jgi:hypothetical protein